MPRKIALFSSGWAYDLMHDYARGVIKRMQGLDVDLYIFVCYPPYDSNDPGRLGELNIFNLPYIEDFDGVMILGNAIDHTGTFESLVKRCNDANVPVVSTGRKDENAYFVGSDNYNGAKELYTHIVEKHGVKHPVFIAGNSNNDDSNTRLDTLCEVMRNHGVDTDEIEVFYSMWEPSLAIEFIHDRYAKRDITLPDAFVCANDTLAISVCLALEEIGYEVPSDTIVTGFDNDYSAEIYSPSITSVDQRFSDLGSYSIRLLLDVIDGNKRNREVYIASEMFESESCGCRSIRDVDYLRRMQGKRVFNERLRSTMFERNISDIETEALAGVNYEEFVNNLKGAFANDTRFIGKTFHLVLEPGFRRAMTDIDTKFRTKGYSREMSVVFSMENGNVVDVCEFESRNLVPFIDPERKNRVFVFAPIHEITENYGYMVFGDNIDIIGNGNHLPEFMMRFDAIMSKVRQNISLRVLNQKLVELTETDVMTHVKNRTAYENKEAELNSIIRAGIRVSFGIGVFDINDLKKMNDNNGHEAGDEYIVNCCSVLCNIFARSPVYRIGGDEFVVVLQGDDYLNHEQLMKALQSRIDEIDSTDPPPEGRVSIAGGIGLFDPAKDDCVEDVFARADAAMYENKQYIKSTKEK